MLTFPRFHLTVDLYFGLLGHAWRSRWPQQKPLDLWFPVFRNVTVTTDKSHFFINMQCQIFCHRNIRWDKTWPCQLIYSFKMSKFDSTELKNFKSYYLFRISWIIINEVPRGGTRTSGNISASNIICHHVSLKNNKV